MRASSRIRFLVVGLILILAIGSVIWWSLAPDPQIVETSATGSVVDSEVAAADSRGSERISQSRQMADSQKGKAKLSTEEQRWVEARLGEAAFVLREIRASHAKPGNRMENDELQIETIHIPALSVEQMGPFYDALSRPSDQLVPGSPVALEFRRRADEYLARNRRFPASYVRRVVNKRDGDVRYSAVELSEDATFKEGEKGEIEVEGRNRLLQLPSEVNDIYEQLFSRTSPLAR